VISPRKRFDVSTPKRVNYIIAIVKLTGVWGLRHLRVPQHTSSCQHSCTCARTLDVLWVILARQQLRTTPSSTVSSNTHSLIHWSRQHNGRWPARARLFAVLFLFLKPSQQLARCTLYSSHHPPVAFTDMHTCLSCSSNRTLQRAAL
jgi:hypothetical protein